MFSILATQDKFTVKTLNINNIGFGREKNILSLLSYLLKRRDSVEASTKRTTNTLLLGQNNVAETEYHLPLEYENNDVLQYIKEYYISQLKLKLQQGEFQDSIQVFQGIPIKTYASTLSTKSSSDNLHSSELQITQDHLIELLQEEEEDEYGVLKPTPYAFDKAWNLIVAASQFMGSSFKRASVSTDAEGGIRLTWAKQQPEAEVRLICPSVPDKQLYLYHEKDSHYGVVKDMSGFTLASWLQWLNQV